MDRQWQRATLLVALGLFTFQCKTSPQPSPSPAVPSLGSRETSAQQVPPVRQRCDSFSHGSFVEAYLRFFYARREDLGPAYPGATPPDALANPKLAKPTTAKEQARAEELQESWSTLDCFGFTEQELDALGVALGLPKPPDRKIKFSPQDQARLIEALGGSVPNPDELPRTTPGTHLDPVLVISDACLVVYQVPQAFRQRLASETSPTQLADRWVRAIRESGPPRYASSLDDPAELERLRGNQQEWLRISNALARFASLRNESSQDLYVEIAFDC